MIRIILLAFNVAIVTFLIYRLLQIFQSTEKRKGVFIAAGLLLLLLPLVMLTGAIRPSLTYAFLYPVAISLYLYMIKNAGVD